MASVIRQKNGRRMIQFIDTGGKRYSRSEVALVPGHFSLKGTKERTPRRRTRGPQWGLVSR